MSNTGIGSKRPWDGDTIEESAGPSPSKRFKPSKKSNKPPLEAGEPGEELSSPPPEVALDVQCVPRSEALWYDDGDMILWVENYPDKTDTLLFRVHRKVLADSGVEPFRTANDFEVPTEGTPGELFLDGIWVNKYEQQSPTEIMVMIFWIYTKPTTTKRASIPLRTIELLLKRSRMHDNQDMRRCALEYLWNMFPSSLNYHHRVPCFISDCYSDDPSFLYNPTVLYKVLHMADEYQLAVLLPLLYYYIANWPIAWITDGLPSWAMDGAVPETQGLYFKLPAEHTIKILKGRSALIEARREIVFDFIHQFSTGTQLDNPTEGCPQTEMEGGETCFNWLMRVHLYLRRQKYVDKPNALEIMNMAQWEAFQKYLCHACARRVLEHMLHGREAVWENIPKWFQGKSWEEVLAEQAGIETKLSAIIK